MTADATASQNNVRLQLGDEIADVRLALFILRVRCSRGDDFLERRIATERIPEEEGLEDSVVGAERCLDCGLNDVAELRDREIFLARLSCDHGEIGADDGP